MARKLIPHFFREYIISKHSRSVILFVSSYNSKDNICTITECLIVNQSLYRWRSRSPKFDAAIDGDGDRLYRSQKPYTTRSFSVVKSTVSREESLFFFKTVRIRPQYYARGTYTKMRSAMSSIVHCYSTLKCEVDITISSIDSLHFSSTRLLD